MKVLQVVAGLAPRMGGPALNVVAAARALQEVGVDSTIFSTDIAEPAAHAGSRRLRREELSNDLDIRLFPVRPPRRVVFSPALDRALKRGVGRYDLVHIHSLYLLPQLSAFRHARGSKTPFVVAPCGALDPYLRSRSPVAKRVTDWAWQRRMLDTAATIHFKTEEERRLVADLNLRAPSSVVPNGLDESAFGDLPSPVAARELLGLPDGPVVLTLGRISHKKGLDLLIESFALVRRRHEHAQLVIAGPDDEGLSVALRAQAEALGVMHAVHFTGMLRGADRAAALAVADVWTLPSRTENFGSAVAEALAAGRPTIVSPAVNLAPELEAARAAVIAELEPAALAAAIVGLLDNAPLRAELAERGREFARRYEWPVVAQQMAAMYRAATEAPDSATAQLRVEVVR